MCLIMVLISGSLKITAYCVTGEKSFSSLGLLYIQL